MLNLQEIIEKVFLAHAEKVGIDRETIQNAMSRLDVDAGVDRLMLINNYGHLIGLPTRPGTSSAATTGVPTASIAGFAPGALFFNVKGTVGSALYCNVGTNLSAVWVNLA